MSGVMDRLRKRRHFPVKLDDETTVYVRPQTIGEIARLEALAGDNWLGSMFALALCVVDDNGNPACPKNDDESDEQYAKRAADHFADIPSDTISLLMDGIQAASKPPSQERLAKN